MDPRGLKAAGPEVEGQAARSVRAAEPSARPEATMKGRGGGNVWREKKDRREYGEVLGTASVGLVRDVESKQEENIC